MPGVDYLSDVVNCRCLNNVFIGSGPRKGRGLFTVRDIVVGECMPRYDESADSGMRQ